MKTVFDFLLDLPSPYNEMALKNAMTDSLDILVFTQSKALRISFLWEESPQEGYFWSLVDECFCDQ